MKKTFKKLFAVSACAMMCTFAVPAMASQASAAEAETETEAVKDGLVTENGVNHIYVSGKLVTNKLGYKLGSSYYKISKKGVATKVSEAQGRAGVLMVKKKITTLKKAFNWCYKKISYTANVGRVSGKKSDYYAIRGFKYGRGDCNVMAACFYQMAKVLGYKNVKFVQGKIKASTGLANHAWVTIKKNGKTYVYDPNFAYVFHKRTKNSKAASGYKMTYTKKSSSSKLQYTYYTRKGKKLK